MEQIIELVSKRAGINEEQARTAVEVVVRQIKERLPGPLAGQVDAALGGDGSSDPVAGIGGMLGR